MASQSSKAGSIWTNRIPTNAAWAALLLKDVGAPVTMNNVQNVMRWMAAENAPQNWANRNNPLNASLGTKSTNGTGSYSDLTTAAQNTAAMIVAGYKGGAIGDQIYNALMSDVPTEQFSVAVVDSAWSSNHYGVASAGSNAAVPGRLSTWFTSIPLPGTLTATAATSGTGTPDQVSASSTGSAAAGVKGCASRPPVFKTGGIFGVGSFTFSACNAKALTAGLLVGLGGVITIVGLIMVVTEKSPVADQALSAALAAATKGAA